MATTKGVTGNLGYYDEMITGEYLSTLDGQSGLAVYDKMRRSDPQIRSMLRAVTLPVVQANYKVLPGDDTPQAQEQADFISACLFDWMSISWSEFVRTALLMLPFGFSIFEKVWSKKDNKIILHKLDPRLPQSIYKWHVDKKKRRLYAVEQQDTDGQFFKISVEKLLIFTNEKEGDNFAGFSILRPVYGAWKIKNELIKIDAIKHERYGVGMPIGTAPEGVRQDAQEFQDFESALEAIYSAEQGYLALPDGYKIEDVFGKTSGGTDVLTSIKWLNEQIVASVLANFLSLGTSETGSRALGQSFMDFFLMAEQDLANYICEIINRWLIPELIRYNWDGDFPMPYLVADKMSGLPVETISALTTAGVLTKDREMENLVRAYLNMPEREEALEPAVMDAPEPEQEQEEPETKEADTNLSDTEKALVIWDFKSSATSLDSAQERVKREMLSFRDQQIEGIVTQLVAGKKIQNVNVPYKADQYQALLNAWKMQFNYGKEEAQMELVRQGLKLSDKPLQTEKDYMDQIEEELTLAVEGAGDKIKSTAAQAYLTTKRTETTPGKIEQATLQKTKDSLGQATWSMMTAKAVNNGWGNGRDTVFEKYEDQIEYIYHSALLDANTCSVCQPKDGKKVTPANRVELQAPDPDCLGRDQCRCANIAVLKAEGV